jgi:Domain of unknown function (DUF397)
MGLVMGGASADQPTWRIGKLCDSGQCVEVGTLGKSVLIRSSADPDGRYVTLTKDEWNVFVAGVKDGDFDRL